MIIVLICLYVFIMCGSFLDLAIFHGSSKYYVKTMYWLLCANILAISYCLVTHSGDYTNYEFYFQHINFLPLTIGTDFNYEPGYTVLNILLKQFTTNPVIAISIITLTVITGFIAWFPKYSSCIFITLSIYVAHFYWWYGIVLLRQALAMLVLLPLLKVLTEKKVFKSLIIIVFASCFHYSALVFLIVLPLMWWKLSDNVCRILIILCFLFGYFDILSFIATFIEILPHGKIYAQYLADSQHPLNILYYIEMLIVFVAATWCKTALVTVNKYADWAIRFLFVALMIAGALQQYEIASRFATYFVFFAYLILLPNFILLFKTMKNKLIYYAILNVYLLVYLLRFYYITIFDAI